MQKNGQSGAVLALFLAVMIASIGLVAGTVVTVIEQQYRAVDQFYARLQGHWAAVGMVEYALSRYRFTGQTDYTDESKIHALQGFWDEMDGVSANGSNYWQVIYPEITDNYFLTFEAQVKAGKDNPNNGIEDTGELTIVIAKSRVGNAPVLSSIVVWPVLTVEVCLRPEPSENSNPDPLITSQCADSLLAQPAGAGQHWIRAFYQTSG